MASISRSFKPSYLSPMSARRPGLPGRSVSGMSNTSERSSTPSSPGGGDWLAEDLLFSARPSPTPQTPAMRNGELQSKPLDSPRASPSSSSRPIAIEQPPPKRPSVDSSSVYTPPAPLSARGDLPGGYFPLHEDQNRVYRSHPFHLDATKARSKSIQRASSQASSVDSPAVSAPPAAQRPTPPPERASVPGAMPSYAPASSAVEATSTALSNMPVASYIPSGVHANPLPMGKYYPSNYENSHSHRPSLPAATVHTDPQVPTYRDTTGHSRNESEAKRRLQQYQRDMIAQATLALNGGNINVAAMSAISLRNLGFTSLPTKPSKPRLAPLGSPGPVTPMNLESGDDGYLGVHLHASEATLPTEEVVRAIRAEEERRRREGGSSSPAVELGRIF